MRDSDHAKSYGIPVLGLATQHAEQSVQECPLYSSPAVVPFSMEGWSWDGALDEDRKPSTQVIV